MCDCKDCKDTIKVLEEIRDAFKGLPKGPEYTPATGCNHVFPLMLYIPPGQKAIVQCPYCGAQREVFGTGPIWHVMPPNYTGDVIPSPYYTVTTTNTSTIVTKPNVVNFF